MKRHRIGTLLPVAAAVLCAAIAGPQARAAVGPGAVGAEYLTLPIGSKSIAMGEVQSAAIGEPLGWLSNPATLRTASSKGFGVFHAEWIMDASYDNAAYQQSVGSAFSLAAGFVAVRRPEIQGYDEHGLPTKPLDNSNYQVMIGLGFAPAAPFAAGVTVKYFNETLDESSASGVGFDVGALCTIPIARLSFGAVAQNLGSDITFESVEEPLPTTLRGGASYVAEILHGAASLTVAADLVKPRYERTYLSAGCDLTVLKTIGARIGYNGREYRPGSGLTLGCGVVARNVSVDYAWTAYGDLGSLHRITLYYTVR
jgi:hypothetical protein